MELAKESNVDLRTIQRFERAEGVPKSRSGTLLRIQEVLEKAGVTFHGDPIHSPGVQLRSTSNPSDSKLEK